MLILALIWKGKRQRIAKIRLKMMNKTWGLALPETKMSYQEIKVKIL